MKKILIAFSALILSASAVMAQAPKQFSYQTVVRNSGGGLVSSSTVGIRISILKTSATGPSQYSERHSIATNANGLASLAIGTGTQTTGSMATIDWTNDSYFVKTEVDPAGGTNYSITGTSQILAAPYALNGVINGKLGIGVTNPTYPLELSNSINQEVLKIKGSPGDSRGILFEPNGAGSSYELFIGNTGLAFCEKNVSCDRFHIKNGGKVGIGTADPNGNLTINANGPQNPNTTLELRNTTGGHTNLVGISLKNFNSSDRALQFWTNNSQATATSEMYTFLNNSSATKILRIQNNGNVSVSGSLAKAGGSFKIDNPANPENEILYHSFVESPDMMNVYNGNVVTDGSGNATVVLPDYFQSLNSEFRYQLTTIGTFAKVMVAQKIAGNTFKIKTDLPNVEVSWQVTGVRKDAWANANRIPNVVQKEGADKGKFLHPEVFGKGEDMRMPSMVPLENQK